MSTYNEMYEEIYGPTRRDLDTFDPIDQKAWAIITMLKGRKNFDHWWDYVDDEPQNEIFEEIKGVIVSERDRIIALLLEVGHDENDLMIAKIRGEE